MGTIVELAEPRRARPNRHEQLGKMPSRKIRSSRATWPRLAQNWQCCRIRPVGRSGQKESGFQRPFSVCLQSLPAISLLLPLCITPLFPATNITINAPFQPATARFALPKPTYGCFIRLCNGFHHPTTIAQTTFRPQVTSEASARSATDSFPVRLFASRHETIATAHISIGILNWKPTLAN